MLALGAVSKMLPRMEIIHIPNSIHTETAETDKNGEE